MATATLRPRRWNRAGRRGIAADVDDDAKQKYIEQTRHLYRTETQLLQLSNRYLSTGNDAIAACVLDWLYELASADAFLGKVNSQGAYARQWSLGSFSSAYLQIKNYHQKDARKNKVVREWLSKIAVAVQSEYGNISDSKRLLNNHFYWAAWSVVNTGVALNKKDFYDWGINGAKYAFAVQVREDGTLPLEMKRGKKALQYHIFSLAPLIMISETATRNGENLYDAGSGISHVMVGTIFSALKDPTHFEDASGFEQEAVESISPGHYSWMEVYNSRYPNEKMTVWLKAHRPIFSRRTGGDMSFLYARKSTGEGN